MARDVLLLEQSETPLEETMWKTVLAGTAALAIAGGSFVYAQQGPGGPERGPRSERGPHWRMSAEDIAAFGDARIAAVHAGLKLTAEQEKNWPAVESALRDLAKQRSERFAARASADQPKDLPKDLIERLNHRADAMTQRGATLKKLADAAAPLYKSLDEGQKHRFVMLTHLEGRHGDGVRGGPGHRGMGGWMHRGPMGPEGGPRPQ
jgi:zinc resistance-associated protein